MKSTLNSVTADELGTPIATSGKRIKSFHASSPDSSGVFEIKTLWDQICALGITLPESAQATLSAQVLVQQSRHWLMLSRLLYVRSLLQRCPGMKSLISHPGFFQWGLSSAGHLVLRAFAWIHFPLRRLRDRLRSWIRRTFVVATNDRSRWIEVQRSHLGAQTTEPAHLKNDFYRRDSDQEFCPQLPNQLN